MRSSQETTSRRTGTRLFRDSGGRGSAAVGVLACDSTPAFALCVRIEELRRREHDMEAMNTRRSLMTGLGAAAAAAVLVPASTGAQTRANNFRPARHANDSWME